MSTAPLTVMFDGLMLANQEYGGISRYTVELAKNIAQEGRMRAAIHAPFYVSRYVEELKNCDVRIRGRRLAPFRGASLIANTLSRLCSPPSDYDIFHSTWFPTQRPCGLDKLFVITVYDMIAELYPQEVGGAVTQSQQKRLALQAADLIFAISESTKADIVRLAGVKPDRIEVTSLATSIGRFAAPSMVPIGERQRYILYVGHRGGYKNFIALLNAFKANVRLRSEFQLVCFGGAEFNAEELRQLEGMPKEGPGSVILERGSDVLLAQRYAHAALFVCPSKYEGFGIPLLEAMTCGCPVVSTRAGSLVEVGGDAPLYADDASAEALSFAMDSMLFDRTRMITSIEAGLRRARNFSWSKTACLTTDAYLRHLHAARKGRAAVQAEEV